MKVLIEKHALKDALGLLASSVKKQPGAITSYILFYAHKDGQVKLRASDNFVYTNIVLGAADGVREVEGHGEFTVEADRLNKWVSNVPDEVIQISLGEEGEVIFKGGSLESPFPSQPAENFPSKVFESARGSAKDLCTVNLGVLLDALGFIKDFPSDSTSNTDPTGKFRVAQLRGDELQGTDSAVLGIFKSASFGADFKIGADQIGPALAYLKRQPEDTEVVLKETDTFYFFETSEDSYFGFVRPRVDLPRLTNVPTGEEEPEIFEVEKAALKSALNALRATADADDNVTAFTVESGVLSLSKKAVVGGKTATTRIPCTNSKSAGGAPVRFSVNDAALEKAMSSYGDNFFIAYNEQGSYIKLRELTPAGDTKICLMTLRIEAYN